jgi:hypothetical protein
MADSPSPPATDEAMRDLITSLLQGAMQASHALDQLKKLAGQAPDGDHTALEQVTQAISTMARVRSALIDNASRLTDGDSAT